MIDAVLIWCARHRWTVLGVYAVLALGAAMVVRHLPLDAVPDTSDPQVIVFTEAPGRAPATVEDQVTFPLSASLLSTPDVAAVRGLSMAGMSFVYVVFHEGTDGARARTKVLERLSTLRDRLPRDVTPTLGPDATGVGWVMQLALVDRRGARDVAELRALVDTRLRYALESVPGVAEVAPLGGFVRQLEVRVDPSRLRERGVTLLEVAEAVRRGNGETGGRAIEISGREHYVRASSYALRPDDLSRLAVRVDPGDGAGVRVRDVATVVEGPAPRRGVGDLDGGGDTAGMVVIARQGENARAVIERVDERLAELRRTLPEGLEIITTYDRSGVIDRSVRTLIGSLIEEGLVVALVIMIFLLHPRSALLPIATMPLAVLFALVPVTLLGVPATITSLGGLAIAIGATVDAEIVMIEACHKHLEGAGELTPAERSRRLAEAAHEVTPAIFSSLLIVAVAFLPVFGLTGHAGKLFRPMALTKTCVMLAAAVLSVTLAPALRDLLLTGRIVSEERHPVSRAIRHVYRPFVHLALSRPRATIAIGLLAVASAVPPAMKLGSEFMPALDEGDLLFMPTTLPGISIAEAERQLIAADARLRRFPEVLAVHGKVGRAETATDPAPLSMVETVVRLQPRERWPKVKVARFWSSWPSWAQAPARALWPDERRQTDAELIEKLDRAVTTPGFRSAWTMPIQARVDMLATGIRTPVGVKIFGDDVASIDRTGAAVERVLSRVGGTRSAFFERASIGAYLEVAPRREELARRGLSPRDVLELVEMGVGGATVETAVEGRLRVPITVRTLEDFRSTPDALRAMPVPLPGGRATVPLGELADVRVTEGPAMLRSEASRLVGQVFVDLSPSADVGGYVRRAREELARATATGELRLGRGEELRFAGQYEELERTRERLLLLVPLALASIVGLLYLQFKNITEVFLVLASIPFSLVGSVWLLYLLDYRLSAAVWVGVIALVGLAAQTGVVMIVYIDHAYERRLREGRIRTLDDIVDAHTEGTVMRVRPKLMTVGSMFAGLVPLLWAEGTGADLMRRVAAPMVGGLATSAFLTLEILPVLYTYWRYAQLKRRLRDERAIDAGAAP